MLRDILAAQDQTAVNADEMHKVQACHERVSTTAHVTQILASVLDPLLQMCAVCASSLTRAEAVRNCCVTAVTAQTSCCSRCI